MTFNPAVTNFLDEQNHPFRAEIDTLRNLILSVDSELSENIKWNGPNFLFKGEDRITLKIQPPTKLQLIFHLGAKVTEQPKAKRIEEDFNLLEWKENNRALATFKTKEDIVQNEGALKKIVYSWITSEIG